MQRAAILRVRVDARQKARAEKVFSRLGLPPSVAVNLFLSRVAETRGMPFPLTLPSARDSLAVSPRAVAAVWDTLDRDDRSYLRHDTR